MTESDEETPTRRLTGHLRLVSSGDEAAPPTAPTAKRTIEKQTGALAHTSRRGITWYLHQGTTKTGKPRFFVAKGVGAGALAAMPEGFEFAESVNGVVSIRRVDSSPSLVTDLDAQVVRTEISRQLHLRHHRVEVRNDEIVLYEPAGAMPEAELREFFCRHHVAESLLKKHIAEHGARGRFEPVLRFRAVRGTPGEYFVQRMTYRGDGGWSYPLQRGALSVLVARWVPITGTPDLFHQY